MRNRNFLAMAFIVGYGTAMALMGYMGRHTTQHVELMVVVTLVAAVIAAGLFWGIWNLDLSRRESAELSSEKRKRTDIDSVLRTLSSADLDLLKHRLMDGDFDAGSLVDSEGELRGSGNKR